MDIRTNDMIIGTSAYADADTALLKEAGIGWVRQNFPFPFEDKTGGDISEAYEKAKASAAMWRDKGFRVMGVTPLYGIGKQEPDDAGHMCMVWHEHYPAYMDLLGSTTFVQNYRELCRFLAQDLHGLVEMWQISNELDITLFAGPLNLRQASDLILESARGLKMGDPGLIVGTNTGGSEKAYYLYGYLHADPDGPLDYCGVDQYYGTWQPGGPERWDARIAELYAICGGVKVLVNEWGYSSAGGLLTEEERETQPYVCQHKKWYHAWDAGHTPDIQAEFVQQTYDVFYKHRDKLLGAFFYRWEDQASCWQCGAPDCPAETAWGLVTMEQQPKPAFYTFKEGVARLREP